MLPYVLESMVERVDGHCTEEQTPRLGTLKALRNLEPLPSAKISLATCENFIVA